MCLPVGLTAQWVPDLDTPALRTGPVEVRGPGQSGPRAPDPWSTGWLGRKATSPYACKRELVFPKETPDLTAPLRTRGGRLPPLLVSYEQR